MKLSQSVLYSGGLVCVKCASTFSTFQRSGGVEGSEVIIRTSQSFGRKSERTIASGVGTRRHPRRRSVGGKCRGKIFVVVEVISLNFRLNSCFSKRELGNRNVR